MRECTVRGCVLRGCVEVCGDRVYSDRVYSERVQREDMFLLVLLKTSQAFSKKLTDKRKEWLTSWLQEKREKRQEGLNESFLYGEQTDHITYSNFINKELILFSNADNERSIPCMVDGLKPGQRKVLFTCFKRNDRKEVKVAQLAGSVAEHSAYHHGEVRDE